VSLSAIHHRQNPLDSIYTIRIFAIKKLLWFVILSPRQRAAMITSHCYHAEDKHKFIFWTMAGYDSFADLCLPPRYMHTAIHSDTIHQPPFGKAKHEAILVTGRWGAEICVTPMIPHYVENWPQRCGHQTYAPVGLYPQENPWYSFLVRDSVHFKAIVSMEVLGHKKSNLLIRNRARDLPACDRVPHPTTLQSAQPSVAHFNYALIVTIIR
jgi:hypothetical protein